MEEVKLSAWGLADDLIANQPQGPKVVKYLFGRIGHEAVAIADRSIREVVDRPKVSPWLRDPRVVGVFALRGDIYTLTDPLGQGVARRIAVVLEHSERYIAVGLDEMTGVDSVSEALWKEFESTQLPWAKRIWNNGSRSNIELSAAMYIETFEQTQKESAA